MKSFFNGLKKRLFQTKSPASSPEDYFRTTLLEATHPYQGRDRGRYVSFDCPSCGKRGRAYSYYQNKNGGPNVRGFWTCNRARCNASGHLLDRAFGLDNLEKTEAKTEELRDLTPVVRPGLGRLSKGARRYLEDRLPGAELSELRPFVIDPSRTRGDIQRLGHQGWELCVLLHAIDDPTRVASLQGRFVLGDERLEKLWGSERVAPKVRSLKGAYGESGATFGRLDGALKAAEDEGALVVVEGLIDFLTARASGLRAVVGVPGVVFAEKLARHLKESGWSGRLILSLDGDEAGAASLLKVLEELEDEADIEVANGRPLGGQDLNDVYRAGGAAAVRALVRDARVVPRPLQLTAIKRSKQGRRRARELYGRHREEKYSALRALGWTGCCGIVMQEHRRFSSSQDSAGRLLSKRPRLCEGKSCSYCRSKVWPILVEKLRSSWPAAFHLAAVELDENDPQEVRDRRRKLSQKTSKLRKELGGSCLTAGDPLHGRLIVLADDANPRLLEVLEAELNTVFRLVSLDEALDALKWSYMGPAIHAARLFETEEDLAVIEADPWLAKRSRWASAIGPTFRLPSSRELEIQTDSDDEKRPLSEPEGVEFDLFLSKVEEKVAAVTIEPLPCKALMAVINGEPIGILSPGLFNLLEYPDELGPEGRRFLEDLVGEKLEGRGRAPDDGCVPAAQRASYYARRDVLHRIERILKGLSPPPTG